MNVPPDFQLITNYDPQGQILEHHVGVAPVLLRSTHNAVQPYYIWCPQCGFKVPGSTIEAAISNWNDHIADPRRFVEILA